MKQINLHGMTCLEPIRGGTDSWYWATDYTSGDLYEAEELFRQGHPVHTNRLLLIHYPDGTVYEPLKLESGCYFGTPIYYDNAVFILNVNFPKQQIRISQFSPESEVVSEVVTIPLSAISDCYNLLLHTKPLMLTRHTGDIFEIVWPEQIVFPIHSRETFLCRENDKLYFSIWYEDPDYREETIVRSLSDGHEIDRFAGSIREMPSGEWWHLI